MSQRGWDVMSQGRKNKMKRQDFFQRKKGKQFCQEKETWRSREGMKYRVISFVSLFSFFTVSVQVFSFCCSSVCVCFSVFLSVRDFASQDKLFERLANNINDSCRSLSICFLVVLFFEARFPCSSVFPLKSFFSFPLSLLSFSWILLLCCYMYLLFLFRLKRLKEQLVLKREDFKQKDERSIAVTFGAAFFIFVSGFTKSEKLVKTWLTVLLSSRNEALLSEDNCSCVNFVARTAGKLNIDAIKRHEKLVVIVNCVLNWLESKSLSCPVFLCIRVAWHGKHSLFHSSLEILQANPYPTLTLRLLPYMRLAWAQHRVKVYKETFVKKSK